MEVPRIWRQTPNFSAHLESVGGEDGDADKALELRVGRKDLELAVGPDEVFADRVDVVHVDRPCRLAALETHLEKKFPCKLTIRSCSNI